MDFDFHVACRTCKIKTDQTLSIYRRETPYNLTPAEMLMACTSIKVTMEDGLPECLCQICLNKLIAAFAFKKECEDTDAFLREYTVIQSLVKTESVSAVDSTLHDVPKSISPINGEMPSKIKTEPTSYNAALKSDHNNALSQIPIKRKRGRPRKQIPPIQDLDSVLSEKTVNSIENEILKATNTTLVRSQRGRPRKCINYSKDFFDSIVDLFPKKCSKVRSPQLVTTGSLKNPDSDESDADRDFDMNSINSIDEDVDPDFDEDSNDNTLRKRRTSNLLKGKSFKGHKSQRSRTMPKPKILIKEENPFTCEICSEKFSRRDCLISHTKDHLKTLNHNCDVCGKKLETIEKLAKHKFAKHTMPEKPKIKIKSQTKFSCTVCEKSFTTEKHRHNHNYLAHEKMHSCTSCKATFKGRDALRKHKTRSNECSNQYLCPDCGRRFAIFTTFKVHLLRHRGEKPFKCQYCNKGFPRQCDVRLHETRHRGEKNHLCTICGRGFNRRYMLTIHVRTHTGERPYKCTFCEAAFTQRNDMVTHVRRHTGERFSCDLCPEEFLAHYMLSKHKRKAHGINIPPAKPILERIQVVKEVEPVVNAPAE